MNLTTTHPQARTFTRRFVRRKTAGPRRVRLTLRIALIAKRTFKAFFADNISRLGAALAFYTTVAVAPLLVLAIMLASVFFSEDLARTHVVSELESLIGSEASKALHEIQNPLASKTGTAAVALGFLTMVFGAFGVFNHLQEALNSIWRTKPRPRVEGFVKHLLRRVFSIATVLMTGFILMASLIASAALSFAANSAIGRYDLQSRLDDRTYILVTEGMNMGIALLASTVLFALIFKLLPDIKIRWRDVWLGALVTALLFSAGKTILGFYLSHASMTTSYGAAGSIIALLVWCYYAAQIVFFGAEATRVTALSKGGRDFSPLEEPREKKRCAIPTNTKSETPN